MKNILLLIIMSCSFTCLFGQVKVFTDGDVVVGNNSGLIPTAEFTVVSPLASLSIKGASFASPDVIDVTGGINTSMRIGAINKTLNQFGGGVLQAFSDNHPTLAGRFFFDMGNAATADINFRSVNGGIATQVMKIAKNGSTIIGSGSPLSGNLLTVSGDIAAPAYNIVSDKRLKKNIKNYKRGLKEVLELRPVSFEYTGNAGTSPNDEKIGIIAQELSIIAPEMVKSFNVDILPNQSNISEKRKIIKTEEFLCIKDNQIKWMLVNAIQDQQSIIEDQSDKISNLENRINDLTSLIENLILEEEKEQVLNVDIKSPILYQNIPNPFTSETAINYSIPKDAKSAMLSIYNIQGQLVKTVNIEHFGKGKINIDASDMVSGTYTYQLLIDGKLANSYKMSLVK